MSANGSNVTLAKIDVESESRSGENSNRDCSRVAETPIVVSGVS